MNVNKTMLGLYEAHAQLENLAAELQVQPTQNSQMAGEELKREVEKLGRQLTQIEGVLGDNDLAIVATLAAAFNENPPRFIGVDMGGVKR
ncbi:hypothetical protein SAMN04487867_10839 [Vreelandella titanicae]|uniref:hypothetical protein n=1 Tax=Vreelandella titanicae TaxID=664683 RepID=UPI0008918091|nr:hypothetical protein [Halomonas titanicae]SDI51405.1 hypothetical protein SAMN04487867_10839 [Halomonas titanicae]